MDKVWKDIEKKSEENREMYKKQIEYAREKVFGIDYESRMVKIAKAYMLIWGDGRANVFLQDSLRDNEWKPLCKDKIKPEFTVIITNPPFAGKIKDVNVLKRFDLGYKNGKLLNSQTRDILFVEMCLKYLKPGGRMAIVLPSPDLANPKLKYMRDYIRNRAKILGVVSLHRNTFKPHTSQKTSVLFLQKKRKNEVVGDYPIFMAVSEKPGKDVSAKPVYKKDENDNFVLDEKGNLILDEDLSEIAEEFKKFRRKEHVSFQSKI